MLNTTLHNTYSRRPKSERLDSDVFEIVWLLNRSDFEQRLKSEQPTNRTLVFVRILDVYSITERSNELNSPNV